MKIDLKDSAEILLPILKLVGEGVAQVLESRDENNTGIDDELANALRYVISRLEVYANES